MVSFSWRISSLESLPDESKNRLTEEAFDSPEKADIACSHSSSLVHYAVCLTSREYHPRTDPTQSPFLHDRPSSSLVLKIRCFGSPGWGVARQNYRKVKVNLELELEMGTCISEQAWLRKEVEEEGYLRGSAGRSWRMGWSNRLPPWRRIRSRQEIQSKVDA